MSGDSINEARTTAGNAEGNPSAEKGTPIDKSIGEGPTIRPKGGSGGRGAFAPGDVIARRYVVEQMLGEGGMGIVYQCLDKVGGVSVAVKCLPPEVSRNADEMEDIRANYRLVSDLHHPNIAGARTLELDESTGDYYLVMDLARGMSLKRWMRRNPQATTEVKLAILRQVAAALDYAHARKVIHRDVKPENVMVDDEGGVKVLDFGLAAQIRSSQSRTSAAVTSRGGTPGYKSPEQWQGKTQREPADVYSFGVMAYWMFAGALPFDGDDLAVLGHAVLSEPVEPVAGLPAHMNAALVKALAKQPNKRFASCSRVVAALEGEWRPPQGRGRLVAALKGLLAVIAIGLAAVGGWWWMNAPEGHSTGATSSLPVAANIPTEVTDVSSVLTDADVAEIAVEASVQKARVERIDGADGFMALRIALADGFNRAIANRKERLWTDAAQGFTNYVNECKKLLALDQERQNAKRSRAKAEAAKASASEADARRYANPRWNATSALLEDANGMFGKMSFVAAATKYAAAAKQFAICIDEAKAERRRQDEAAADKAKAKQEKHKLLEGARDRAKCIEAEIVRDIEPVLKRFKAEDCAQATLADGNSLRKDGNAALSRGDYSKAEDKLKQAKEKLAAAVKEARGCRIDAPLRHAREHSAASRWQQCIDECDKVLGWEASNAEALQLKADAESRLVPTAEIVIIVDGRAIGSGETVKIGGTPWVTPVKWGKDNIKKGISYYGKKVSFERGGKRYTGELGAFTVNWNGLNRMRVVMTEEVGNGIHNGEKKTITLPGGATMEMIYVEPNSFTMGSPEYELGRHSDEMQRRVKLTSGFWLGKYEVTQRQWESVMGGNPSRFKGPDRPVEQVSWEDCQRFIQNVNAQLNCGARLPSEAEWEYACRAGSTRAYGGTGNLDDMGWYSGNSDNVTHDVGNRKPNKWGFYDMHGNVYEYCENKYNASGDYRMLRGGCWNSRAKFCRSAFRNRYRSDYLYGRDGTGFRLCCSTLPNE